LWCSDSNYALFLPIELSSQDMKYNLIIPETPKIKHSFLIINIYIFIFLPSLKLSLGGDNQIGSFRLAQNTPLEASSKLFIDVALCINDL